jgi:hypothetical protein
MNMLLKIIAISALISGASFSVLAETQIIYAGELLAVPGEASKTEQSIVIKEGKIIEVRDGYVDTKRVW